MLTFDKQRINDTNMGIALGRTKTHDGKWVDSSGSFYVNELERLDQTLNMPLVSVEYTRDVDMRTDSTIGDESSSYTQSTIGSAGGLGTGQGIGNSKAWISKNSTQITGVSVDIGKVIQPLHLYGIELKYSIPELESAARLGRPIDAQKFEAMELKHQMDTDEQVYIGDTGYGDTGLVNSALVTAVANFPNGALGSSTWESKSPDEILNDFNLAITTPWTNSGWKVMPNRILIPPVQFGYIATAKVATAAGTMSIKRYIEENNLLTANSGAKLEILPSKWLVGAGVGGTIGTPGTVDRMVVYTKDYKFIRYPKTDLQRTQLQFEGIFHKTTYYCRLGVLEVPYPETVAYFDGL